MQPRQPTPENSSASRSRGSTNHRRHADAGQHRTVARPRPRRSERGHDERDTLATIRPTLPEPRTIAISDPSKRVPDNIVLALGVVTPITFLDKG